MIKIVEQVNRSTTSVDYQTGGVKKIRISNNLSALDVVGQIGDNSMLSSLKIARLGSQVKKLLPGCFMNCNSLVQVEVPEDCQYIQESAFMNCESMAKINCIQGEGQILKKIGTKGFAGCNGLLDVTLKLNGNPSELYEILGNECFASCQNLQTVKFTGSAYISKRMFQDCNSLTSIQLANMQGYMYPEGLANIHSLESITIPNKTWIINDRTFKGCESLTSVVFEDGDAIETSSKIELFGNEVFDGCESLKEITIPKSITSFSQLGENFLAGSSISCVRFSGIPQEYFGQYEVQKKLTYNTGKWYVGKDQKSCNTVLKIAKYAHSNKIPLVVQFSRDEAQLSVEVKTKKKKKIEPYADSNWANASNNFVLNEKYFFIKIWYDTYYARSFYDWLQARINNQLSIDSDAGYPYIIPMWNSKDGFKYEIYENPYKNSKLNTSTRFNNTLNSMFSGYTPPTTVIHTITENSKVSLLGLNTANSCLYYASDGSYRTVNSDGTIKYNPQMLVDEYSKINFKTGRWYYNAQQLKQFADKWHIPVVIEYSSKGCTPCEYWARNSFNNDSFQNWIKSQKFLFCRVEKKSANESWLDTEKYPQLNFVEYQWVKARESNIPYPPVFCWYWSKDNGDILKDVSSYHFDQGLGSEPPWTDQQFYQMTLDKFSGYREDSSLSPGLSCPVITKTMDEKNQYPKMQRYENQYVKNLPSKLYADCKEYDIDYLLSSEEGGYLYELSNDWKDGNSPYDEYNELSNLDESEQRLEFLSKFISGNVYKGEIDPNGVFFTCQRKEKIDKYYGTITLKSGKNNEISSPQIGDSVAGKADDGTYQIFLAKNAYKYDKESLIIRIRDGKVEYMFKGFNDQEENDEDINIGYRTGEFIRFTGSQNGDGLSSLIDQAEIKDIAIVIAVHVTNEDFSVLGNMASYVSNSGIYWVDLEVGNVSEFNNEGTAANQFRKFTNREYIGTWNESEGQLSKTPFLCLYKGCSSCGVGQPAVYMKRIKTMGNDANQLTAWVEKYKNMEEI